MRTHYTLLITTSMKNNPICVYLLSSERSGSNLLRHRLCLLADDLCSVPPAQILRTLGYWEPLMGPFSDQDKWLRTIRYALRCCYERAVPWEIEFTPQYISDVYQDYYGDERTLVRLVDVLYREYARKKGFTGYFCKEIRLFDFAESIAHQLPHARFVHLYRDPRDYVLSQKNRPFGNKSTYDLAGLWLREANSCLKAINSLLVKNRSHSLSYEQLLQNETRALQETISKTGMKIQENIKETRQNMPKHNFHELKNVHLPTMKSNFNKYKSAMHSHELRVIEAICWNTMRFLGYNTEHLKKPSITLADEIIYKPAAFARTKLWHRIDKFRFRNEPVNRWATQSLVSELTEEFR
jgi:hypothetical protein